MKRTKETKSDRVYVIGAWRDHGRSIFIERITNDPQQAKECFKFVKDSCYKELGEWAFITTLSKLLEEIWEIGVDNVDKWLMFRLLDEFGMMFENKELTIWQKKGIRK